MYSIEIKKITREQVENKEFRPVGEDKDGKTKYDYVTEESTEDVSRTIYTQKVEDLDITAVIDSVNGKHSATKATK